LSKVNGFSSNSRLGSFLVKIQLMSTVDWFWLIALISTVFPIMEICIVRGQALGQSLVSFWGTMAALYSIFAVYSEVYYANYLVRTSWWQQKILTWWYYVTNSKPKTNGNGISDIIRRLEYVGLLFAPATYFLGKPAVIVYVNNRKSLPYGYYYLVLGWWLRLIFEWYGIKYVLSLFNAVN